MQETVIKQSQESLRSLPVLYKREDSQPIQYNPIQEVIQLWITLSEKDTVVVYQQAAGKTWQLFKQAISVIFFFCQLLIALIIWMSGIAFQMGQIFRNKVELDPPNLTQIISALFQLFLWPLAIAYHWADSFIKQHLGWDNPLTAKSSTPKLDKTTAASGTSIESSSVD